MVWVNEIEAAMPTADVKTLYTSTGKSRSQTWRFLMLKIARGRKKITNGDFKRRVSSSFNRKLYKKTNPFSGDESVLNLNEILKVDVKNDNVQSCNTR